MPENSSALTERTHYTAATVAKARALYVVKGVSLSEISVRLDIPLGTLGNWSAKGAWTVDKEKRQERLEKAFTARAEDDNAAFLESVRTQAEELTEDTFGVAREAIARGVDGAKELQMSSGALRNFFEVYRVSAGIDRNGSGNTVNIGSIFCQMAPLAPLEKQAEPVSTDTTQQPKQLSQ